MGILCLFNTHKWNGCKCAKCGKERDEQHLWDGCICTKCGKQRDEAHNWDSNKCVGCGLKLVNTNCDVCSEIILNSSGFAFYSDVLNLGNIMVCKKCTERIITEEAFISKQKYSIDINLDEIVNGIKLDEVIAESIVRNCKKLGLTPEESKRKGRELALEFYKDAENGREIIYSFWKGNDNEKKSFNKVKIASQIWMTENLDVDHYRNGDLIPEVTENEKWADLVTGAWCYYDNDPENGKKYGKLYNWYAINDPRGLAPKGWHIPSKEEFEILEQFVNSNGNFLKAIGEGTGVGAGTNKSGFSALLAGYRGNNGTFYHLGSLANFWNSTEYNPNYAIYLFLLDNDSSILLNDRSKGYGFSVRCIEN